MPSVKIKISLRTVQAVCGADFVHTRIGCAEFGIFTVYVEIVCAAEVILRAGAADGGEVGIAVDVELDLTLAPPAVALHAPVHVSADVVAVTLDSIKNNVIFLVGQGIYSVKAGVEIKRILGDLLFLAIDLIVKMAGVFRACVVNLDAEGLEIGHLEVGVHALCGVHADSKA